MLINSKSILARLMATENLLIEERNVPTAFFDLKSRILTVPMLHGNLSPELYDLLLGHEVGHALETPEKGWHDSIIDLKVDKSILNVCEDVRIEKKIKRKFPGIRFSFIKGYRELMDMDFFKTEGKNLNDYNFIDRLNLFEKCGATLGIEFTKEESILLKEVENTETFDEVVEVAKKIQEFMKSSAESKKQPKQGSAKKLVVTITDDMDSSGESVDIDMSEYDEIEIVDERTNVDESTIVEPAGKIGPGNSGSYFESLTDNSFRDKEKSLIDTKSAKEVLYTNIPNLILENIVIPFKDVYREYNNINRSSFAYNPAKLKKNFSKFRKESDKVVSYLIKEFELRKNAEQQNRSKVSKTGELNMSKLQDYMFSEDIFKRITTVPNGKSHGLVMFIDWSGSMSDHINPTIKQLLNLVFFCRKLNIPYDVYAISSHSKIDKNGRVKEIQVAKAGDLLIPKFSLPQILSSKMSNQEFTEAASYLLDYGTKWGSKSDNCIIPHLMELSGTPLNEAIIAAFQIVEEFKKNTKMEIVNTVFMTDGDGSSISNHIDYLTTANSFNTRPTTPTTRNKVFFRDPVTKAVEEIKLDSGNNTGSVQTKTLFNLMKQRLGCNIVGFYVCKTRDVRDAVLRYTNKDVEIRWEEFRKNNYTWFSNVGYDDYYILKSEKLDTDDEKFNPTFNTTKGLVSAFSKYTGNKVSNRIVLNRFIKLIA